MQLDGSGIVLRGKQDELDICFLQMLSVARGLGFRMRLITEHSQLGTKMTTSGWKNAGMLKRGEK